mmetsp:Transcript_29457/g.88092  ORF Transcript_29457/g.88092 Transcript_29457/m.88092 type:complete len:233 (+) Transcript_29457:251-949(+)
MTLLAVVNYALVAATFSLLIGSGFSQRARVGLAWLAGPLLVAGVGYRAFSGDDLAEELSWYASYHSHPVNQLIHLVFVPELLFTVFFFLAYAPPPLGKRCPGLTWPLITAFAWSAHHVRMDAYVGSLVSLLTVSMALCASGIVRRETVFGRAAKWALAFHALGWYAQLHPGHKVFEGRKPALLEGLIQALLDAPLFVWYHPVFEMGLYSDFKVDLDAAVGARHAAWASAAEL